MESKEIKRGKLVEIIIIFHRGNFEGEEKLFLFASKANIMPINISHSKECQPMASKLDSLPILVPMMEKLSKRERERDRESVL